MITDFNTVEYKTLPWIDISFSTGDSEGISDYCWASELSEPEVSLHGLASFWFFGV